MFLLWGNFVIPCKARSCLLWHLPCKMQDAHLQLMKAICPFQKYPSEQSHGKGIGEHQKFFSYCALLHSVRWWSKHLLYEVQEQKAESYFPFTLEMFFVPVLEDRPWGLLWGSFGDEGRIEKWAVMANSASQGHLESRRIYWNDSVQLTGCCHSFFGGLVNPPEILSTSARESVDDIRCYLIEGSCKSHLWNSDFWGLLPSKSLFHREFQCDLDFGGIFWEVVNQTFTRAYLNAVRLVPDQDWLFQSQQLRSCLMCILNLDSAFVSQTLWAEFQCVCRESCHWWSNVF